MREWLTKWKCGIVGLLLVLSVTYTHVIGYANESEESFSVLLLGIDTGAYGREEQGRSDVIMVMTVSPKESHISLTSIPRDTYVDVPELEFRDKLNHAYAYGGSELALKVVNAWLDSDIRYYMQVDFAGIAHVVDALGGIDVVPPATFDISGFTFVEGQATHLDGEMALAYARERYTSGGDYARQGRQREILQAIVEKLRELEMGTGIQRLLPTLLKDIKTNLNFLKLMSIYQGQKNTVNDVQLDAYQLEGEGAMIDGVYYDLPNEDSVNELKMRLLKPI